MTPMTADSIERVRPSSPSVTIGRHPDRDGAYRLRAELFVPRDRRQVFEFFADARQLETITPPWLHFEVLTPAPIELRAGVLIDYRLRLRGVPFRWQSRIAVWEPPDCFVDEQTRGPYRLWRHEHRFEEADGGTVVRDQVDYAVPGGALVHGLLVRRDVERIFVWRHSCLERIFGHPGARDVREPDR